MFRILLQFRSLKPSLIFKSDYNQIYKMKEIVFKIRFCIFTN